MVPGAGDPGQKAGKDFLNVRVAHGIVDDFRRANEVLGRYTSFQQFVHAALIHYLDQVLYPATWEKLRLIDVVEGADESVRDVHALGPRDAPARKAQP